MTGRIHDRYLLTRFLRIFLISVIAFVTIYVIVDAFEEIDNFIDHDAALRHVFMFYLYSIPFVLTYVIPVSLLLATIFSMGILSRRNELTAFIASGISLVRVAAPILVASVLLSIASTAFNDLVVTKANRKQKDIKRYEIEGAQHTNPFLKENFHYLGEKGYVYLARRYNHQTKTLLDVVVQHFDEHTLTRRIDAKQAKWEDGRWVFYSGVDRVFGATGEQVSPFQQFVMEELEEDPKNFAKEQVDEENMNAKELHEYINKVRKSGGKVERHLTDFYFKFSYPIAGTIFVILGIAFSSGKRKQSLATGFGLTLLISFLYYGVLRVGQTLGYNGIVPPALAAQLGNVVFLGVGVGLISRANQ